MMISASNRAFVFNGEITTWMNKIRNAIMAAKLGVTRRRRIAEAADILDRYEFGQHRFVPRDRFASETGKASLARLDQK